jgi:hypothetical protein
MKIEVNSRSDQAQRLLELEDAIAERFRYYNRRRHHAQTAKPPATYLANSEPKIRN